MLEAFPAATSGIAELPRTLPRSSLTVSRWAAVHRWLALWLCCATLLLRKMQPLEH